ncbi:MAG: SpoIIE family protein phosphatase [Rikenellaceae bacterium]|nr:SpoIIE family protein phosphatase [Rikenellaceae bacterium]
MMQLVKHRLIRSFSTRLTLVILLVAASLFILAFWGNNRLARRYVERESIEHVQSTLDNTILRIDNVLQSVELAVHNLAWTIMDELDNPDYMYSVTRHIIQSNHFVSGSAVAFEPYYYEDKGSFFAPYAYREGDQIKSKQLGTKDYDYHYMDWYQIPRLLNKPYWSEPYYDEGGGNMIMTTYSYPLYDEQNHLIAIFTADLSLEWFAEQVNAIRPYPNSYNIMIGRGGTFLVHRRHDAILNETMFSSARTSNDSAMIATAHRMVDGKRGLEAFNRNGEHFYLCYAPVAATGWSVAVACLHSDIFAGVNAMRKFFFWIAAVGLLLLSLLCFLTIRRMTRPLTDFAQSAREIAQGNFSAELPAIHSKDEMRTLHDSFHYMQQSLRSYINELQLTTANKERIESELRIARSIQLGMVPKLFPPFPEREDVDLYATLIPAREVGGDLYDFFIENEQLHFIIGDVSGKGVPASLVMAVTCRLFRTVASHIHTPEGIVSMLNEALAESNESNMFCTAFVGILDLKSGDLRYCNAGHNPPMVVTLQGDVEPLAVRPNLALGVWPGFSYEGQQCHLEQGTSLFMYTDGVTEAENSAHTLFGDEGLLASLKRNPSQSPRMVVEQVLRDLNSHAAGADQSDDITILCCNVSLQPTEDPRKHLVLRNDISEIGRMATFLEELGEELQLTPEVQFNLHLALEEAVSNVIMYAFPEGEEHEFLLTVRLIDNRLIFKIIDDGKAFDPTRQPDADVTLSLEERPIGGLGIFLIRRIMQAVEYRRVNEKNILTMVKVLDMPQESTNA